MFFVFREYEIPYIDGHFIHTIDNISFQLRSIRVEDGKYLMFGIGSPKIFPLKKF